MKSKEELNMGKENIEPINKALNGSNDDGFEQVAGGKQTKFDCMFYEAAIIKGYCNMPMYGGCVDYSCEYHN